MKQHITAVIIEDEQHAVDFLQKCLEILDFVTLLGIARDETSGYKIITQNNPDIVFLDIKLGNNKNGGFDLLQKVAIDGIRPSYIVTTGHGNESVKLENSLTGYSFDVFDFLLKPFTPEKVEEILLRWVVKHPKYERIRFATIKGEVFIDPSTIWRCESGDGNSHIYTDDKEKHTVRKPLKEVIKQLQHLFRFKRFGEQHFIDVTLIWKINRKACEITLKKGEVESTFTVGKSIMNTHFTKDKMADLLLDETIEPEDIIE